MSDYYQPKIEEFHVGFRYEALIITGFDESEWFWEERVYDGSGNPETWDVFSLRVKCLDRADIESLGWQSNEGFNSIDYGIPGWLLKHDGDHVAIYKVWEGPKYVPYYQGRCRNVSKLRMIMDDIGVEKGEKIG